VSFFILRGQFWDNAFPNVLMDPEPARKWFFAKREAGQPPPSGLAAPQELWQSISFRSVRRPSARGAGSVPRWRAGGGAVVQILAVPIDTPDDVNVIIGQSHFIKTIEDLYEAMVAASPQIEFGIAFCEASGPRLVRRSGNASDLVARAVEAALTIGCGHCFVVMLRKAFPVNVLNAVKAVGEVCSVFCATANPVEVLVAETGRGRGVLGVVDGSPPLGVETDADERDRKSFLRRIGYKL
jgi:uncharacterized protein